MKIVSGAWEKNEALSKQAPLGRYLPRVVCSSVTEGEGGESKICRGEGYLPEGGGDICCT